MLFAYVDPILSISSQDYPSSTGWSIVVFICGCDFNCIECSNTLLQQRSPFFATKTSILELTDRILKSSMKHKINNLTLLGGDPLAVDNRIFTVNLCKVLINYIDICIYTGYNIEEVRALNFTDFNFVKCGMFDITKVIKSEKTDSFIQFASTNQELYNNSFELLSNKGRYYFKENLDI